MNKENLKKIWNNIKTYIDKKDESVKEELNVSILRNLLNNDTSVFQRENLLDDKTDSLNTTYIQNELSDFGLPSWVGKIEKRTDDLVPSINNAGQSYIYENGETLELRIVKDGTSIVGVPITLKKENEITTKTFSMIHFGDSITYGVGANPNYVTRLKTLLEADGHTISKQTNKGISGATAESLYNAYKNMETDVHDVATLMIGINDQDRWLRNENTNWKEEGIKPYDFRLWYRTNLNLLINLIIEKTQCSKFFLIVPYKSVCEIRDTNTYYPSEQAYFSQPLQNIVVQEVIAASKNYNIIHLCRADYYVPNSYTYIADGLHANNDGAQLLAKGLRDEITFRV